MPVLPRISEETSEDTTLGTSPSSKVKEADSPQTETFSDRSLSSGSTVSVEGETEEHKAQRKAKKDHKLQKAWQEEVRTRQPVYLLAKLEEMVPKQLEAAKAQCEAWQEVHELVLELRAKVEK